MPAGEPVAALLLLRDAKPWLSGEAERVALAALLARTRPRHVFVEVDAGDRRASLDADPSALGDDVVRLCAAGMTLPHVALLGYVGARAVFHVSVSGEGTSADPGADTACGATQGESRVAQAMPPVFRAQA